MSNGSDIAAEIATGLAEAGTDAGDGPLVATVNREPIDSPVNPWDEISEIEPTTYDIIVIRDSWKFGEIDGTKIRADDLKLMMQSGIVTPTTADTITIADVTYQIINVMPEAVAGVDLYYMIQARK